MQHIVSFSGGRTSAYLVYLMEEKRKSGDIEDVDYIFMDTGAEHPKTYEFIKKCVKHFGIDLTCLRTKVNPERGKGTTYNVVSIGDCKCDLKPWRDYASKYGVPQVPFADCTKELKITPYEKYVKERYGKGEYTTWLGIRADEPKRLTPKEGIKYLADISYFDKRDIFDWWQKQPFDLEIESEWLGNCVFCLKKGISRIALAARDEPELAKEWSAMIADPSLPMKPSKTLPNTHMYRGGTSMDDIIATFSDYERKDILRTLKGGLGACEASCEVFNCQNDLFSEEQEND